MGSRVLVKHQGRTYSSSFSHLNIGKMTDVVKDAMTTGTPLTVQLDGGDILVLGKDLLQRAVVIVKQCAPPVGEVSPCAPENEGYGEDAE